VRKTSSAFFKGTLPIIKTPWNKSPIFTSNWCRAWRVYGE
jgi:hypothetical protein